MTEAFQKLAAQERKAMIASVRGDAVTFAKTLTSVRPHRAGADDVPANKPVTVLFRDPWAVNQVHLIPLYFSPPRLSGHGVP